MSRNISKVFRPLGIEAALKIIIFSLTHIEHRLLDSSVNKGTRLTAGGGDRFSSSEKLGNAQHLLLSV